MARRRRRAAAPAARRRRRTTLNPRTGGFLGIELKFLDVSSTTPHALTAPTAANGGEIQPTAGCTGCLSAPAQGDGEQQRDGRKIIMRSIFIQGFLRIPIQANQSAIDAAGTVYLALVWHKQTNGATINSEDVFTNPSANTFMAAAPFRNMTNTTRFTVLQSMQIPLPQVEAVFDGTNIEQSGYEIPFKMSKSMNIPVSFTTGTTADVANVVDNSLHLVGYVSSTGTAPVVFYTSRMRFVG